jgi:ABC-type amino acid transport substrate-binding protein
MDLPTTQYYKDLFDAIAQQSGLKFDVQVVPPPRAGYLISNKQVDVQAPQLAPKDPDQLKAMGFDYGSIVLAKSAFVLFSNKAKPIDIAELKRGNPKKLVIETDGANVNQFGFVATVSTNITASLQKVNDGKIDGYIHSQTTTNPFAKKLDLKNSKRQLYEYYDLNYALPKGERGGALDKALSDAIKKLKDGGKYDQIMGKFIADAQYTDWQP